MDKVEFTFKTGRSRILTMRQAALLARYGIGTYETRDMAGRTETKAEDLSALDKAALHALAKARGVKVHHMAGADKVRAALEAAQ